MVRHAAKPEAPQLPVRPEALQLSVAAQAHVATRGEDLRRLVRLLHERVLALMEPARPTQAALQQLGAWREARELRVLQDVLALVPVVLAPRRAEVHEQSRRVRDAALRDHVD